MTEDKATVQAGDKAEATAATQALGVPLEFARALSAIDEQANRPDLTRSTVFETANGRRVILTPPR